MKSLFFVCCFLCSIAHFPASFAAEGDNLQVEATAVAPALTSIQARSVANFVLVWGFVKYFHLPQDTVVADFDESFTQFLPQLLLARDSSIADGLLARWLDGFSAFGIQAGGTSVANASKSDINSGNVALSCLSRQLPPVLMKKVEQIVGHRSLLQSHLQVHPRYSRVNTGNSTSSLASVYTVNFSDEQPYKDSLFPSMPLRLLALARYWNAVGYFSTYIDQQDLYWFQVLTASIPVFYNASDTQEYQEACLSLIAQLPDTKAALINAPLIERVKGEYLTPLQVVFSGDTLVVAGYYHQARLLESVIKPGDRLVAIDGITIDALLDQYQTFMPGCDLLDKRHKFSLPTGFLMRSEDADAKLTIRRGTETLTFTVGRIKAAVATPMPIKGLAVWESHYIACFSATTMSNITMEEITERHHDAKGLIIDLRSMPATEATLVAWLEWLLPHAIPAYQARYCDPHFPGNFLLGEGHMAGNKNKKSYKGKVAVLIGEGTNDAGVKFALVMQVAGAAVLSSTPDAHSLGQTTSLPLPGGMSAVFTTTAVSAIVSAGNIGSQRVGEYVPPTAVGMAAGKDELLLKAVVRLQQR